jgi:hypothetical protein
MINHLRHLALRIIVGLIRLAKSPPKSGWQKSRRQADELVGM